MLARPRYAIFQTASLHLGIERPVVRTEDFIDAVPQVLDYLDEKLRSFKRIAPELIMPSKRLVEF